jgi:hypothetical protein
MRRLPSCSLLSKACQQPSSRSDESNSRAICTQNLLFPSTACRSARYLGRSPPTLPRLGFRPRRIGAALCARQSRRSFPHCGPRACSSGDRKVSACGSGRRRIRAGVPGERLVPFDRCRAWPYGRRRRARRIQARLVSRSQCGKRHDPVATYPRFARDQANQVRFAAAVRLPAAQGRRPDRCTAQVNRKQQRSACRSNSLRIVAGRSPFRSAKRPAPNSINSPASRLGKKFLAPRRERTGAKLMKTPSCWILMLTIAGLQLVLGGVASDAARRVAVRSAYDGTWSVAIYTRRGGCGSVRAAIQIVGGRVHSEDQSYQVHGAVGPGGAIRVSVASGGRSASGSGRLSHNFGAGRWRTFGGECSGNWSASRRAVYY